MASFSNHRWVLAGLIAGILGCSACSSSGPSAGDAPAWVHQPARTVDGGYIVYVGTSVDHMADRAQLDASSVAIGDLANECSLVPKGARVEDHYTYKEDGEYHSYAKVSVEFQDCEAAKRASDPEEIRKLANQPLTQQLARYQDFIYDEGNEEEEEEQPTQVAQNPPSGGGMSQGGYFAARQQVAFMKEVVILAPPTAYAPGSTQSQVFVQQVQPNMTQVQTYESTHPETRTWGHSWSRLPSRPQVAAPRGLRPAGQRQGSGWRGGGRGRAYRGGGGFRSGQGQPVAPRRRRRRGNGNWR